MIEVMEGSVFSPEMIAAAQREAARVEEAMNALPARLAVRFNREAIAHYLAHKVTVPPGQSGNVVVEQFSLSAEEAEFAALRAMISSQRGRGMVLPGIYTRLRIGTRFVMSDTPDEIDDHSDPIHCTREGSRVLIHGLGIGMVLQACLEKGAEHVDVVELDEDVIEVVAPHYLRKYPGRVTIHRGNALTYKWPKGVRWNVVWHDIWDTITADNLPDMRRLHRRFGRRCDWQGSWCRELCERW